MLKRVSLFLKGMAMGGADVIPGVSGGTIAFISGIYEELINAIKSINLHALQLLFREGFGAFWRHINGSFLITLFLGIGLSIITLARVITHLLATYPIVVWAFFFGLILGSVYFIGVKIKGWNVPVIFACLIGAAVAYFITVTVPSETPGALYFIFFSGFIAICAMILPGISGSFILLLMGKYEYILNALKEIDITVILTFIAGCVAGLLSFSHVIAWLFKKYHDLTVALLTGFMIGSLNKVWPWKEVLETRVNSHGEVVPLVERSILPATYQQLYQNDPMIFAAILAALAGLIIIIVLEIAGRAKEKQSV